ncbi:hypothetical protein PR048_002074 [Dryococelus australis]|uniref:Uncharacterized protein n=1 Tax=Dryococelus australis TaxID=614101 RepID=A0ABQ9IJA8_9NEOP|nr:hypothetical protein PR048_002074 [Dryococelus australis]
MQLGCTKPQEPSRSTEDSCPWWIFHMLRTNVAHPAITYKASTLLEQSIRKVIVIETVDMCRGAENHPAPECVVWGNPWDILLIWKNHNYFRQLLSSEEQQVNAMVWRTTFFEKVQVASYIIAKIHNTIAEDVILPACKEIVKLMLGDGTEKEISVISLSNDNISRQIDDMSSSIQSHVHDELSDGQIFSLQFNESTVISKKCQLLSYIRFIDEYLIIEQFFSFTELPSTSTIADNVGSMHCFIHNEALVVVNTVPAELESALDSVINMEILLSVGLKQDLCMTLWFFVPRSTGCEKVKSWRDYLELRKERISIENPDLAT